MLAPITRHRFLVDSSAMITRKPAFRIAGVAVTGIAGLCLVVLLFAWSGLYSVAASRGHWAIVEWFLAFGMSNSVATHTIGIKAPPLGDPDLVRLGAGHFHSGCAYCRGAPGMPINPVAKQMLPAPPQLSKAVKDWKPKELFWIVKHGLKYTGMPGWVAIDRDDEVWAVVAFLQKLPDLDVAGYRELALGGVRVSEQSGLEIAIAQSAYDAVGACARCHGSEGQSPKSSLVPVLHGQSAQYLALSLRSYASGRRGSGVMQPVASELRADEMSKIATYYAQLRAPTEVKPEIKFDAPAIERGRVLAVEGLPADGIPPCLACHGPQALPTYPRLLGQHADYMAGQLRLWKRGLRSGTDYAAIMAPIALRLSDQQIDDIAKYFASMAATGGGMQRQ
jgi:cytochrome c553